MTDSGPEQVYCQRCGGTTRSRDIDGRMRPVCVDCGAVTFYDPKLAVAVVIARDGRLLFGRRAEGARAAGLWSFPGGFVERGEQVEAAAIREVREEVGLEIELGDLIGLFSSPGETVVLAVYVAAGTRGDAIAADDIDEVGWFLPGELPDLAFDHDRHIIDLWLDRQRAQNQGAV